MIGPAVAMLEALIGAEAVTRCLAHLHELSARVQSYAGAATALRELSTRFRFGGFIDRSVSRLHGVTSSQPTAMRTSWSPPPTTSCACSLTERRKLPPP